MVEARAPLSDREREVLQLLVTGATNLQIARRLVISPNTVKVHLRNIYDKMGVQSRTEASMVAVREGWVGVQAPEQPPPASAVSRQLPPVAAWQRVYLVASLIFVLMAATIPTLNSGREATTRTGDLNDPPVLAELEGANPGSEQWKLGANIPTARSRFALVAFEDRLYAIAGATADGVTANVQIYDPVSNGWLPGAPKLTSVSNVAAVALDGSIFVPGGYTSDGEVADILEIYNPRQDTWRAGPSIPGPLCGYAIAALDGALYTFGGWDGKEYLTEVYSYDPVAGQWSEGHPLSQPRAFAAAVTIDDKILLAGGWDGKQEQRLVEEYDPVAASQGKSPWSMRSSMSAPRGGLALAAVGSEIYAIGGGWRQWLEFNERYDPDSNTWSTIPSPLVGQWRHLGAAVLEGRVFAMGGWSHGHLAVNAQYRTLYYRIHFPLGEKGGGEQ